MVRSKRILFTFDPRRRRNLREFAKSGGCPSVPHPEIDALRVARAVHDQARLGFTEIVVRNPFTNQEKVMVLAQSHPAKRAGGG